MIRSLVHRHIKKSIVGSLIREFVYGVNTPFIWNVISGDGLFTINVTGQYVEPFFVTIGDGKRTITWAGGNMRKFIHTLAVNVSGTYPDDVDVTIVEGESGIEISVPNGVEIVVAAVTDFEEVTPTAVSTTLTDLTDVAFADFPVIAEPDLATVIIPVSGTYTGDAPTDIQARVINESDQSGVTAFNSLTNLVAENGDWAGDLTILPGNGRYLVEARNGGSGDVLTQTVPFRTAGAVIAYGQSNLLGFLTKADPAVTARNDVFIHRRGTTQDDFQDPIWEVPTGGGILSILNELAVQTGITWVCIAGGQNASKIVVFDNTISGGLDTATGNLDRLRADIGQFGKLPHMAIWHQGEGDAVNVTLGEPFSFYETPFNEIWATIRGDFGSTDPADLPVFLSSLCTHYDGATVYTAWDLVDSWHLQLAADYPHYHWAGSWKDAARSDPFHAPGPEYTKRGRRNVMAMLAYLGEIPSFTPFQIASATAINDTTTDVTISHGQGTDFGVSEIVHFDGTATSNTTEIRGFEVGINGAYIDATGVRIDATTIRLTHAALSQIGRTLLHLAGENPDVSGMVVDNSAAAVPLLHTAGTPIAVADGVATGATVARQVNGYAVVSKVPTVITPTLTLAGATRFLYGVQFGSKDVDLVSITVNGATMTPLGSYLLEEVSGAGVASGKVCRMVVFETDQTGDLVIDLGTAQHYSTGVSVAIVEAAGVTGAWSILDSQIETGTAIIDELITHASVTPGDGDLVAGLFNVSIQVPGDTFDDAYTGATIYNGYNGNIALGVGTDYGDGTAKTYSLVTNAATKRAGSVIATIGAA